jgi:predicted phosphodiesterase
MRKLLRALFLKPILRFNQRRSSRPDRQRVFAALTDLLACIMDGEKKKGLVVPFEAGTEKFIVFSDMHKGAKNGADDFAVCEAAYLAALEHYYGAGFQLIALGDCEELWENSLTSIKKAQQASFELEKKFVPLNAFIKIFGNHDLHWQNDPLAPFQLKEIYGTDVPIYEGVVLQTVLHNKAVRIYCTHGHQGDLLSDGNWFSKFFIAKIWAPFQSFLRINPNTPAFNDHLKSAHNTMMYEWSAQQQDLILITGHTHQPVFESLTHIERLYRQLLFARQQGDASLIEKMQQEIAYRKMQYTDVSDTYLKLKPSYFNSGCCCFNNGGITGIEISGGVLRLIQWKAKEAHTAPERIVLEETPLEELLAELEKTFV